ncbi:hypothetical protein K492DRAFT_218047 [Lichtheimia hyalospora FSU 10163]|nr:hypothetical protein K492DRAFT_218047 [Lichtheimia hyalospora FSU 10163]
MTKENTFDRFIEVPYDILSSILDKLSVYDLYECILTCHSWYDTILMLSRTVSGEQCKHDEVSCNPNYEPWYLEELGLYRLFSRPPPVIVIEPCSQQNRVFRHLTLLSDAVPDLRVLESKYDAGTHIFNHWFLKAPYIKATSPDFVYVVAHHLVLDSRALVWVVEDDDDDIIKQRIRKTDAWIQDIKTPQLMHLECIDVDVSGPVLRQWLMKSTALKSVTLGGEQLTEDALDALGYLPQLRHLHLTASYAIPPPDTTFLPYISLLDNLQSLSLHCSSFVTDKTLPAIGSLSNLKALEIKHWNVSESGIIRFVVALKQASNVSQLKLQALGSLNERTLSMLGNVISLVDLTIIKCIVSAAETSHQVTRGLFKQTAFRRRCWMHSSWYCSPWR